MNVAELIELAGEVDESLAQVREGGLDAARNDFTGIRSRSQASGRRHRTVGGRLPATSGEQL